MLPSLAGLKLCHAPAPTGVAYGLEAHKRRKRQIRAAFRDANDGDVAWLNEEVQKLVQDLTPDANQVDLEQAVDVLTFAWSSVPQTLAERRATMLIQSGAVDALVELIDMGRDPDTRFVALRLLRRLLDLFHGSQLVHWHICGDHTANGLDFLIYNLVTFLTDGPSDQAERDNMINAVEILRILTDGIRDYQTGQRNAETQWFFDLHNVHAPDEPENFDERVEPRDRVCASVLRVLSGVAIDRLLSICELDRQRPATRLQDACLPAAKTLKYVLKAEGDIQKFIDFGAMRRVVDLHGALDRTNTIRSTLLRIAGWIVRAAPYDTENFDDVTKPVNQVRAALPVLFAARRQRVNEPNADTDNDNSAFWFLMQGVVRFRSLRNMLVLDDSAYAMFHVWLTFGHVSWQQAAAMETLSHVINSNEDAAVWARLWESNNNTELSLARKIVEVVALASDDQQNNLSDNVLDCVVALFENREAGDRALRIPGLDYERLVRPFVQKTRNGANVYYDECLATLAGYGKVWNVLARQIIRAREEWVDHIAEVIRQDNVLMEASTSQFPSGGAAMMFLHKLIYAHIEILTSMELTLTGTEREKLARMQKEYGPMLAKIREQFNEPRLLSTVLHRETVNQAIDFLEKLMAFPSLNNPQQDSLAWDFAQRGKRPRPADAIQDFQQQAIANMIDEEIAAQDAEMQEPDDDGVDG